MNNLDENSIAPGRPMLGEVRLYAGYYAPENWAFCDGKILSIKKNDALFKILGTSYGGDGRFDFGLPNLNGRVPIGVGRASKTTTPIKLGQGYAFETSDAESMIEGLGMHYIICIKGVYVW